MRSRARVHPPNVIVSDFHLRSGETGASVFAAVRKAVGDRIPVVFITGRHLESYNRDFAT
jgi:hypothetical protein